ncbi:MAG: peroxiredoxin family protein [Bacteroidota bacterium]
MRYPMKCRLVTWLAALCLCSIAPGSLASSAKKENRRTLLKALQKCKHIKSGNYDIVLRHKFPFEEEITSIEGHCTFSKLPSDKVLGARVALTEKRAERNVTTYLHDGRYEVLIHLQKPRLARISDLRRRSPYYIAGSSASGLLFEPLLPDLVFSPEVKYFFQESIKKRARHIQQLPEKSIEGRLCTVFAVYCKDREEVKDEVLTFYIDQELSVPIKYIHRSDYWGAPTYTEATISNFTLNYQEDPLCIPDARALIPSGYEIIKDYEREWPQRQPLSAGVVAPLWKLPAVPGGALSLASLRGKVVLMHFWYKNFGPSLQCLQQLQSLQEKFQNQELVVVGINPCDSHGELTDFLSQRGITYPNLLGNEQVTHAYHAHNPNTFYLIDQSGKVYYAATVQENFPKKLLSKKIKQLLKRNK